MAARVGGMAWETCVVLLQMMKSSRRSWTVVGSPNLSDLGASQVRSAAVRSITFISVGRGAGLLAQGGQNIDGFDQMRRCSFLVRWAKELAVAYRTALAEGGEEGGYTTKTTFGDDSERGNEFGPTSLSITSPAVEPDLRRLQAQKSPPCIKTSAIDKLRRLGIYGPARQSWPPNAIAK